ETGKGGAAPAAARVAAAPALRLAHPNDDATFLRRVFLDLTGTAPSRLETAFFVADRDPDKRKKVVEWLLADEATQAYLAKRLHLKTDRVRVARVEGAGDETVLLELVATPGAPAAELAAAYRDAVRVT